MRTFRASLDPTLDFGRRWHALAAAALLGSLGCSAPPAASPPLEVRPVQSRTAQPVTIQTGNNSLVSGLGGAAGFGETEFSGWPSEDDSFLTANISSVFTNGINFFGSRYDTATQVFIGSNGYITFGVGDSSYSPSGIAYSTIPIVAALYTDLWVSSPAHVYMDLENTGADPCVTFTWYDVWEYGQNSGVNSRFQIRLHKLPGGTAAAGDPVGIEIRYNKLALISHSAAGGWADGQSVGGMPTAVFGEVRGSMSADILNNGSADTTYSNYIPAIAGVYYWAPASITLTGGGMQSAPINTAFPLPLTAHVTDSMGNNLQGATVSFTMPSSGASATLSATSCTTNSSGDCSVTATANGSYGSYTATAFVSGDYFSPGIEFSMTNTQVPAHFTLVSGNNQSVVTGTAFGSPLVVQVQDSSYVGISGAVVTFTAPGSGASITDVSTPVSTDGAGQTSFTPTANASTGSYSITATLGALTQTFSATNTPQMFTLDFVTDGTSGSSLAGTPSQSVAQGADASAVTANAPANYHFVNWTGTGGFTPTTANPVTVTNVQGAMTLTAHFAMDTYLVSFQTDGTSGSTLTGTPSQTINHGSNATAVTANAPANHHFVDWTGTGGFTTTTANPLTVTNVTGAMTITANFQLNDVPPTLTVTPGTTTYTETDPPVVVDSALTLTDPDGPNLTGAKVSIGNFVPSEDWLSCTAQGGVTCTYDSGTGVLALSGNASAATYQAVLRSVSYSNVASGIPDTRARQVSYSLGTTSLFSPDTGHYYEFVSAANITWHNARTEAATRSYYGLQGYLVTVTSAAESTFVSGKLSGEGWMGATDETVEWTWRWVTGPEGLENAGAGRNFFIQSSNDGTFCASGPRGSAVGSNFQYWSSCEPNNWGSGEDYAHFRTDGMWNDYPATTGVAGYVVEYGGMPGDPVLTLSGIRNLSVVALPRYTLTPSAGGNGSISPNVATQVRQGSSQNFNFWPNANYRVADVQVDGTSVGTPASYLFSNVAANHSIAVSFGLNQFTVGFGTDGTVGSSLTGTPSQNVLYGGNATAVLANAPTGYHFVNWTGTGGFTPTAANPVTVTNVTQAMALTAHFAINQYTVTFLSDGTAGVSFSGPTSQTITHGSDTAAVTANAPTGYHFVNWTGSLTSTANPLTVSNITQAMSITANFALNQYAVSFVTDGTLGASLTGSTSQTVTHGTAAAAVGANPPGTHYFTGWSGTGGFSSPSNPVTVSNVTQAMTITANFTLKVATSVAVSASANPSFLESGVSFTASVTPADATGTVQFSVDGLALGGPVLVAGGQATSSSIATLVLGNHSVQAVYSGDVTRAGSTGSLTGGQVVRRYGSSVALTSSANPSVSGQSVALTATVTAPGGGTPTGTLVFMDGARILSYATLDAGGVAHFSTAGMEVTFHDLWASYAGDPRHDNSQSVSLNQLVEPAGSLAVAASDRNPALFGQSVTLTVQVGPVAPGAGLPSGSVTFLDGGTALGSVNLVNGTATLTTSSLAVGTRGITVAYSGDGTFHASVSAGLDQVVQPACVVALGIFPANALNPENPCLVCRPARVVESWSNLEDGVACTSDGLSCTLDVCDGQGACAHRPNVGCLVDGACVADGALDPENDCKACRPQRTRTTYAPLPHLTACADDGNPVTEDLCDGQGACLHAQKDQCLVDGQVVAGGQLNPANSCQVCNARVNPQGWTTLVPGTACADDGLSCTGDRCDAAGQCEHPLFTGCLVDGACVTEGTTDPGNDCKACQPALAAVAYTDKARGVACADDGVDNTQDTCDGLGACVHPLRGLCMIDGVSYRAGDPNPENACQSCDPAASVAVWTHRVAGFPCPADDLACTADQCDGAGSCVHPRYMNCLIDNTCIAAGATDPENDCRGCYPEANGTAYTAKAAGVACADDGFPNTADTCNGQDVCVHPLLGECVVDGETIPAGTTRPDNPCQACQPAISISAWTDRVAGFPCTSDDLECTADTCDGAGTCEHHLFTGCLVDSACVAVGMTDPQNDCQGCFPAAATTRYTAKARGVACADDGQTNTGDVCNGASACVHPLLGECVIDGQTVRTGTPNPANDCEACDPATRVDTWTSRAAGFPCAADALSCTQDVCNGQGVCEHPLVAGCLVGGACVAEGAADPSAECMVCVPLRTTTEYSPRPRGVACTDDGFDNTLDQCDVQGRCEHVLAGQCRIAGLQVRAGTANPANACQSCDPSASTTAWTDRVDGFPCPGDGLDCTADVCTSNGQCAHPLATGCVMDGACVETGALDPENDCRSCQPEQATDVYLPRPRGVSCADDGMANTLDSCDGAGMCTHVVAGQCTVDGVIYNAGATDPENPCRWCDPQSSATAWSDRVSGFPCTPDGLECTADVCGVGAVCQHTLFTGCQVDNACVAAGATDPAAECRACIPAVSTTGYSAKALGVACTDDGQDATLDRCNGTGACVHVLAGECNIAGQTYAAGAANPDNPCQSCDPAAALLSWSNRVDGFPCGTDGQECTADVCNSQGSCEHRLFSGCVLDGICVAEGALAPANECLRCDSASATDAYSPVPRGTPCADDGDPETLDVCSAQGTCTHERAERCTVLGVIYNPGADNPENACQWCDPASSRTAWSNRPTGTACASDNVECTADSCDGAGLCVHRLQGGCLIEGACVAAGTVNPKDGCFECNPALSREAWSRRADAESCGASCVTDAECGGESFCQAHVCRALLEEGGVCTADGQCRSGTCRDGTCAGESSSSLECACSTAGSVGSPAALALLLLGLALRRAGRR